MRARGDSLTRVQCYSLQYLSPLDNLFVKMCVILTPLVREEARPGQGAPGWRVARGCTTLWHKAGGPDPAHRPSNAFGSPLSVEFRFRLAIYPPPPIHMPIPYDDPLSFSLEPPSHTVVPRELTNETTKT